MTHLTWARLVDVTKRVGEDHHEVRLWVRVRLPCVE